MIYNFVLDTVTLSNLLPLCINVPYCTSTDHLKIDYETHDYGDVLGVPQNKMNNKYFPTHSLENSVSEYSKDRLNRAGQTTSP